MIKPISNQHRQASLAVSTFNHFMTETKLPKLPSIAATVAFITAAVVLITALFDVYLMPPASNGSAAVAASMFAFPIMFLAGGILLLKRAYTDRSLGGSAICLMTMVASAMWALAVSATGALAYNNSSWDGLILVFPLMAIIYVLYPALIILSVLVFVFSLKTIFAKTAEPDKTGRNGAIAIIIVLAIALASFMGIGIHFAAKSAHDSQELMNYLEESQAHYTAEHNAVFEKSIFPTRGFELENYYDIEENDVDGGYDFFYRSKKTGLSWRVSESKDGKLSAALDCIFNDASPLSALELDEFVLVENGGDYLDAWYSATHGGKVLKTGEVAVIVDEIDKDFLDSYTQERIASIVNGDEDYKELPPQIR